MTSQERSYPAITQNLGQPSGAVVLAEHAATGRILTPGGQWVELAEMVVPAANLLRFRPPVAAFGDAGRAVFRQMRVAVVGVGGIGSLLVEYLARLGVGQLVLIDPDRVDPTNLPRLVAARRLDAMPWLRRPASPGILRALGKRLAARKTRIAARNARRANPAAKVVRLDVNTADPRAASALTQVDWIFLAADTAVARHVVNAVVQQHLLPAIQVGVAIPVRLGGDVGDIHVAMRPILPGVRCLWCDHLIDPTDPATETLPGSLRAQARYVADVPAASVVTFNSIAAAEAATHFMQAVTDLHIEDQDHDTVIHEPRYRSRDREGSRPQAACRWCSRSPGSALADGDFRPLPSLTMPSDG
ncbi:ThiF family adenylyltransferase [Actinomadura sp. NTSP31]|uniref:ThiF family adenylyltransferase n=1 Tax=Actinomadura sp. NTSP31 TaxID=1735447 RepID=UPI0035BF6CD8